MSRLARTRLPLRVLRVPPRAASDSELEAEVHDGSAPNRIPTTVLALLMLASRNTWAYTAAIDALFSDDDLGHCSGWALHLKPGH